MDILVCLKQTFDTEAKIVLDSDGAVSEEGVQFIVNPYDEYAVEEAIKLKEEHGGAVTVVTMGPARVEEAVRTALAMGADEGVIVDNQGRALDEFAAAEALAAAIQGRPFDLILAGNQAVDDGSGQVAVRLAELLKIPHVSTVTKLTATDSGFVAERDAEGDTETVKCSRPALITAQQGLNEPRYPSLIGIRKASKKPLTRLNLSDLNTDAERMSPRAQTIETYLPKAKGNGRVLAGTTEERAAELAKALREVSKVI